MNPDRRRAGRAIRKARRLEARRRADLERQLDHVVDFARRAVGAISRGFAAVGAAATAAAEAFTALIPPRRTGSIPTRRFYQGGYLPPSDVIRNTTGRPERLIRHTPRGNR